MTQPGAPEAGAEPVTREQYTHAGCTPLDADLARRTADQRGGFFLQHLRPGMRVLDCGCGLGWFLKVIDELAPCRLTGLDNDLTRLRRARAEISPRVSLAAGSVARLPYADGTFDKVILSEVLEHIPEDLPALLEVRRVVRSAAAASTS